MDHIIIHVDGGSRGNPGPGAAAFILTDTEGNTIDGKGIFLGETTNNIAEYVGVLEALGAAKSLGAKSIEVFSDSELVVRQINGRYKVKNTRLKEIYLECMGLLAGFGTWRITHITRDKNIRADSIVNRAMDLKKDVSITDQSSVTSEAEIFDPLKPSKSRHIRLGILISGGGTTMVNIQKQIEAGGINAEIAIVISSLSSVRGVELAKKMGLRLEIVRRKDFADVELFSARLAELLEKADVDLVVQAGWLCLWRIPKKYENRVMNIHPALLPSFGGRGMWGRHVHEAVLDAGCKISGCTVHFCNNEYDAGPIIVQRCCEVKAGDDSDTLADRVFEQECIAYPQAIRLFSENRLLIENGKVKIKQTDWPI